MPLATARLSAVPRTPAKTTARFGRRPVSTTKPPVIAIIRMFATMRRRRGPPHTAMAKPPRSAPIPSASDTWPTFAVVPKPSTSGAISSTGTA
jgi:hypothetical protein